MNPKIAMNLPITRSFYLYYLRLLSFYNIAIHRARWLIIYKKCIYIIINNENRNDSDIHEYVLMYISGKNSGFILKHFLVIVSVIVSRIIKKCKYILNSIFLTNRTIIWFILCQLNMIFFYSGSRYLVICNHDDYGHKVYFIYNITKNH